MSPVRPPQTPPPSKHVTCAAPPLTWVPGGTRSGFLRESAHGPRLEKLMMSLALSAPLSVRPQLSDPPKGCTFSHVPTVITFLAVPGVPTLLVDGPLLPAAKTMTICWLPLVAYWASRTKASYRCESLS